MSARWESTPAERRAVLESDSRVLDLALVILLLCLFGALVAGLGGAVAG